MGGWGWGWGAFIFSLLFIRGAAPLPLVTAATFWTLGEELEDFDRRAGWFVWPSSPGSDAEQDPFVRSFVRSWSVVSPRRSLVG